VRVNSEIVRGCLMLAVQCDGATVETIEGLSDSGEVADLQTASYSATPLQVRLLHAGHGDGGAGAAQMCREQ
jgi:aerobic-type carbon monoxide dehydrogenase small subunit (CoxS/CutS family)